MLQSTPMPCTEHSNDALLCQQDDPARAWTRMEPVGPCTLTASARPGPVDVVRVLVAVARAYADIYNPADDVTPAAILGPSRTPAVAQARHLCAYLLAEDYHLTNLAVAHALGRADHTTALNSRARIAAALPQDTLLARVLARVRADLAGHRCDDDEHMRERRDEDRRRARAEASSQEWYEYRYWRLRALYRGQGA